MSSDKEPLTPISSSKLTSLIEENEGTTRLLQCRTVASGGFRREHFVRDLEPFGDTPTRHAGLLSEETAPTPSEQLLAALGSCIVVGIHANAVSRSIPISQLELVVSGELNFGALWGTGDLNVQPIGFDDIAITANIGSSAPRSVLQSLLDHVLIWSPVANSLHNPISLTAALADA